MPCRSGGTRPRPVYGREQADAGEAVLAEILRAVTGTGWPALVLSAGAVVSIFSVVLVTLFGQTRILFSMARDGLVPQVFSRVDRKRHTPARNTWIVGAGVGLLATFVPLQQLADLTSLGTLMAFVAVAAAVVVLRRTNPDAPRPFRLPLHPLVPVLAAVSCLYLAWLLPGLTWTLFGAWLLLAAGLYLGFGRRHSRLERAGGEPDDATAGTATAGTAMPDAATPGTATPVVSAGTPPSAVTAPEAPEAAAGPTA
ncbi:APC family permease [Streptomyces sp. NPDC020858]|uniref:APC family permease n=1 Tax=Streptomyces sp. NPDC020858 TaxID=3365097 RepID=UPI0037A56AB7